MTCWWWQQRCRRLNQHGGSGYASCSTLHCSAQSVARCAVCQGTSCCDCMAFREQGEGDKLLGTVSEIYEVDG